MCTTLPSHCFTKKALVILIWLIFTIPALHASNPVHRYIDKRLIKNLVTIHKDSIHQIECYFSSRTPKKLIDIGFGWKIWDARIYKGEITLEAYFYYYNDQLTTYHVKGQLPDATNQRERYLKWYNNYFELQNNKLAPFFHDSSTVFDPLEEIPDSLKNVKLNSSFEKEMRPTSSLLYYWKGGYSMAMHPKRTFWIENESELNFKKLMFLTYSKNAITRFYAIEELFRRDLLNQHGSLEDYKWIIRSFEEVPIVNTMHGCMGSDESSWLLVNEFSTYPLPQE